MALFAEEDWGASAEVKQLEKGLFGSASTNVKIRKRKSEESPGARPKRVRGPRRRKNAQTGQTGVGQANKEKTAKKTRRGKRKRLSKVVVDGEEGSGQDGADKHVVPAKKLKKLSDDASPVKKLKLKRKNKMELARQAKRRGPRNKYKHLALKRQEERENREDTLLTRDKQEVSMVTSDEGRGGNVDGEPEELKTRPGRKERRGSGALQEKLTGNGEAATKGKKLKKKERMSTSKTSKKNDDSEGLSPDAKQTCERVKSRFNKKQVKDTLASDDQPDETGKIIQKEVSEGEEGLVEETSPPQSGKKKKKKGEEESLGARMKARLDSGRFRFLNEQLYTCRGEEAYQLMQEDEQAFKVYHDGFRTQVSKWPQNPLMRMIEYVGRRPASVVADFGCGDGELARRVRNKVHSFDLVALNDDVVACNMAHVPLGSDSVDIAVFCLSLMGTDLVDFICEANRVLKQKGTLLVAEVKSRFEKVGTFVRKMSKLGFELVEKDDSNKMFVWFAFTKKSCPPSVDGRPEIKLTACTYKKR